MARAAAQVADGSGGKLHIVASLGRLLEPVGLPRYAAICGGPQTAAVLQAYQGGGRRASGSSAGRRSASGWSCGPARAAAVVRLGPVMGEREAGAFVSVAAALELAVAGGELRPPGPGAGTRPSRRSPAGTWRLLGRSWMGGGRRWGGG